MTVPDSRAPSASLDELDVERLSRAMSGNPWHDFSSEFIGDFGTTEPGWMDAVRAVAAEYRRLAATVASDASEEETNG